MTNPASLGLRDHAAAAMLRRLPFTLVDAAAAPAWEVGRQRRLTRQAGSP